MHKKMVECEDGRTRQARVWGDPKEDGEFEIFEAGVRLKGKHVGGEAWHSRKTKIWYFMTSPADKNIALLPRHKEKPDEALATLLRSPTIRRK